MLILHIIVALWSVAHATWALASPSISKLRVSYALITATFASGTVLIVTTHTAMLRACLSGLVYAIAVSALTQVARSKLSRIRSEASDGTR